MGNGIISDAKGAAEEKLKKKHLLIRIPGENHDRKCLSKDSLMYVAYSLNREYVHLPGINDGAIKVSSLSNDMLRSKVSCTILTPIRRSQQSLLVLVLHYGTPKKRRIKSERSYHVCNCGIILYLYHCVQIQV